MTGVLLKRGIWKQTWKGGMWRWTRPSVSRGEKPGTEPSLRVLKGTDPADNLGLGHLVPRTVDNKFLSLKPPNLANCVTLGLENEHRDQPKSFESFVSWHTRMSLEYTDSHPCLMSVHSLKTLGVQPHPPRRSRGLQQWMGKEDMELGSFWTAGLSVPPETSVPPFAKGHLLGRLWCSSLGHLALPLSLLATENTHWPC